MGNLAAMSALAHAHAVVSADLTIREDADLRIVHLFEKREDPALGERVAQAFGVTAPAKPNTVAVGAAALAWIAPGQWLALGGAAGAQEGIDVSDAYAAIRLSGPRASDVLGKSVPVDLAATLFPPLTCVRTLLGAIPIFLMRDAEGFLVLVERPLAHAAWSWLTDGAAALSR